MVPAASAGAGRPIGAIVAVVCAAAFVVLAAVLIPWQWLPDGGPTVPADHVFSAAEVARGERVSGALRHLSWASLAVSLAVTLVLGLTTLGVRLVRRLPGRWWSQTLLAVLALILIGVVVTLPFSVWRQSIRLDEGLSTQSWSAWLGDRGLSVLVAWVTTSIVVLVVVGLSRRLPRTWPAWAAATLGSLVFVGSFAWPVVVEPLFNDFRSMEPGGLRTAILDLADREGVPVDDVLVADASRRTTALNAYVSGIGSTRRVVVYDTLLDGLSPAEVEVVVAHELAHAKHRDVLVGTTLAALGAGVGVGLLGILLAGGRLRRRAGADGVGTAAVVPLLLALMAVGTLLASPVENTMSRAVEARADATSLEVTGATGTFVAMQRELALHSLADPTPPRWSQLWFGSHPTVLQRVAMAEQLGGR